MKKQLQKLLCFLGFHRDYTEWKDISIFGFSQTRTCIYCGLKQIRKTLWL